MKKPRSKLRNYLEYLGVRFLVCLIQAIPGEVRVWVGDCLAWIGFWVDKRHRNVARQNLLRAFPEKFQKPEDADPLVFQCYNHYTHFAFDIMIFPRKLTYRTWKNFFSLPNRILPDELHQGKPVLVATGHFGNWEVAGYMLGASGMKTYAIARRLDNPYLDAFVNRFRQNTGQTILDKNNDALRIGQALASNSVLCTLADQDAGEKGLFVDFFGQPASTHRAVAVLALYHRATIVVSGVPKIRKQPMLFEMQVADVIYTEEYLGRKNAVQEITIRYTQALEKMIREYPEQYLWLHRRWKHQPKKVQEKAA